ncbi:MAG TPA: sigma-70 family RNA polymerase sigma factor [Actinocrinis sp.]|nr:sigma-70 family RNA polymerase sigma factor [Actinocrinis sp.]
MAAAQNPDAVAPEQAGRPGGAAEPAGAAGAQAVAAGAGTDADGRTSSSEEFGRLTDPFRHELLAHCYRMLGSVHDAEDLVQETYLRAWRSYGGFQGRSSLRTWLYRIATNACLTALEHRERRALPSGLGAASEPPTAPLPPGRANEIPWLEPMPDALVGLGAGGGGAERGTLSQDSMSLDPAAVVVSRESMRLAWVAALQLLPPRQRAALILHDVLAWRAHEVAELLGTTTAAVNSALQRARTQLQQDAPTQDAVAEPADPKLRSVLDRYAAAFERSDLPALLHLLREDVIVEMPPRPMWYAGREAAGQFFGIHVLSRERGFVMVPTRANGQPAVLGYIPDSDGVAQAHAVHVLTITDTGISRIVAFLDPEPAILGGFGLPLSGALPATRR